VNLADVREWCALEFQASSSPAGREIFTIAGLERATRAVSDLAVTCARDAIEGSQQS